MKKFTGFTLIETMVAITILSLAVVGPLFTASRAITAAQGARYELTASYLAQEGIEYVRAMRDNEYLAAYAAGGSISSNAWNNFLSGSDGSSITQCRTTTCTLDPVLAPAGMCTGPAGSGCSLQPCSGNSCTPLYLASGVYTQQNLSGSVKTVFTRTVQAVDVSANDKRIVSTVAWSFHGIPYAVTVTDHLTPWQ
ncbi:prepilin-type N-terminal cleavage/methylation domain-containing protein [Patescibacteria group bacterium]|nr:prepilin-type N-terminal cleavage/methylation domain-containing protein [Patescibacteria group bacterium]MDE2021327.1 prepilin-type N-terminal cleavage/methylation domain-containing protein [Patescibacteria group bacterium]MDE2173037.1 prepilin-type N-terminal cleavage/methylation domain-containing protein [Patescibacteria group bacterium]